jgi:hypothetical protein
MLKKPFKNRLFLFLLQIAEVHCPNDVPTVPSRPRKARREATSGKSNKSSLLPLNPKNDTAVSEHPVDAVIDAPCMSPDSDSRLGWSGFSSEEEDFVPVKKRRVRAAGLRRKKITSAEDTKSKLRNGLKKTSRRAQLESISEYVKDAKKMCAVCCVPTDNINYQDHFRTEHPDVPMKAAKFVEPLKCPMCPYSCRVKDTFENHLGRHGLGDRVPQFDCPDCGQSFKHFDRVNVHRYKVANH